MTDTAILAIFRLKKMESRLQLLNLKKCNMLVSYTGLDMGIFAHPLTYFFRSVSQLPNVHILKKACYGLTEFKQI